MNEPSATDANYRLDLAYDGRAYYGWQRHEGKPTIQASVEDAITACTGVSSAVHASGRTDRGVHALGQVANVWLPASIDIDALQTALAAALPSDIQLLKLSRASADFHARSSSLSKTYRYVIYNAKKCPSDEVGRVWHVIEKLDVAAMRSACEVFVGQHDFASFAKKTNFEQASTTRTIHRFDVSTSADDPSRIELVVSADGFLWKMVRNLVRAVVKVGEGRTKVDALRQILQTKDRAAAPGTAPASGLYLDFVEYAAL